MTVPNEAASLMISALSTKWQTTLSLLHTPEKMIQPGPWDLHIDPYLTQLDDPIPLLQVFVHHYHDGLLAPKGNAVHSCTVEGAFCAVGQMLAALGCPDPRLQPSGKLEFRSSRQLTAYSKQDLPPS